jgi:hypothetical protein
MDLPNRHSFEPARRLETPDPSSAPAHPIPLDPNSDSETPKITIVGDEYTYDGIRWHFWDRTVVSYAPPMPEDLSCLPTSLVDPHDSIHAAHANISGTMHNAQVEHTRSYPIRPASASRNAPESVSTGGGEQSAPDERPTPSSILWSRELERQIEQYAAQLQAATRPEDRKTIMEEIMCEGAPTPQAMRQYYRRTAARCIERERALDETWESEKGREGMLFGSELVRGRKKEERPDGDMGGGVGGDGS